MTQQDTPRRRPNARKNEVIGGGFFVFRRGKKTGRIGASSKMPYEHGSFASAMTEATRLAALCPGETYEVFQTSGATAGPIEAARRHHCAGRKCGGCVMLPWTPISLSLPLEGLVVDTKIDDHDGVRNVQRLKRQGNLWFTPDGSMYVYYRPTHWRAV